MSDQTQQAPSHPERLEMKESNVSAIVGIIIDDAERGTNEYLGASMLDMMRTSFAQYDTLSQDALQAARNYESCTDEDKKKLLLGSAIRANKGVNYAVEDSMDQIHAAKMVIMGVFEHEAFNNIFYSDEDKQEYTLILTSLYRQFGECEDNLKELLDASIDATNALCKLRGDTNDQLTQPTHRSAQWNPRIPRNKMH